MSDLTDNYFYPSAERIQLGIRLNNAGKWACDRLTEKPISAKKNHLRWSSFCSWRVCKQAKRSHLGLKKPARIHCCEFWSRGLIGPFFFENEEGETVTVNGDRYRARLIEFLFTKIEDEDIGNIWFPLRYMPHSRSYTRCFAACFWRSHYQSQSWCRLATSELQFDTVGLLFVGCRQR